MWGKPPSWGRANRRQQLSIGLRLRRSEKCIAKQLATLIDSRIDRPIRWRRLYTAPQRRGSRPEIDTWFRINCAIGDAEGLRQATAVASSVKSTHWVIADGVTRVLVGWDLNQLSEAHPSRAVGLLRGLFAHRRVVGPPAGLSRGSI
ncbi:hypothetical protein JF770_14980 [Mycobacterium intracellulare]|uniref:hypothetical protein n=1 Tax=Mycobacterium intracellulare TaxID=1767 RepID=UPI001CD97D9E|nr:hypothetical protein [Mycobacterium intracellulare]MCA2304869.1 hypothetical protein [Mycobacterium intracellulare]MCA2347100.1 hypothetical protein [Mycobacterium intracellulare]